MIALIVVLAASAGTLGYLGTRHILKAEASPPGSGTTATPGPTATNTGAPETTGPGPTKTPTSGPTTSAPPPPPDSNACPPASDRALVDKGLKGGLQLVLYVEAKRAGAADAVVWICKNEVGTLYYQGWVKNGPFTGPTSRNTLLLGEGFRGTVVAEGAGFVATNPGRLQNQRTEYHVTTEELVQTDIPSGRSFKYEVTKVVQP